MEPWVLIVIVVVAVILLFIGCGFLFFSLAKSKAPKVQEELMSLVNYEVERGKKLIALFDRLNKAGFKRDNQSYNVIKNGVEHMAQLEQQQRAEYKNMCDFCAMYLAKVYKEDKNFGKLITKEESVELSKYQELSDAKYKKYNSLAGIYNTFLNMPFTRTVNKWHKSPLTSAMFF